MIYDKNKDEIQKGVKKQFLTKNESKILNLLLENKGKIVDREEIIVYLWENEKFIDENTLSVNIARLRKKLKELDLEDFIVTKKGKGYIIC